jgi:hypothetical protein
LKGRHLKATDLARSIWRLEGVCEYDNCAGQLQGAHIFGVGAYPRLRDDLRNGLSLSAHCHRRFTDNPILFTDWIRTTKYAQYLEPLLEKNKQFTKRFWDERLIELRDIKRQIEAGEITLDQAREYDSGDIIE